MLQVREVHKNYGEVRAVRGVSFEVERGEVVGFLGANGAGKSTTFNMIAGLLRADSGSVRIGGADVYDEPDRARPELGFAPQAMGIYPTITVRENLEFFGRLEGMRRSAARDRAAELMDRLGLAELADRQTMALSGGERRRVHIAAAMMHRPSLLLLDEPSVGMDVRARATLLELVDSLAHRENMAICFSSHYMTEVEEVCDRAVIVHEGAVVATGSVDAIVRDYAASTVELKFNDDSAASREIRDVRTELPGILAEYSDRLGELRSLNVVEASLEMAFLALTGVHGQEAEENVA